MIGNPGETVATIKETIDFALSLPLDDFQITNYTPFPGSKDYRTAVQFGRFDKNWGKLNMLKICFIPYNLTAETISKCQRKAYLRFYLRSPIIFAYLKMCISAPGNLLKIWRGGFSLTRLALGNVRDYFFKPTSRKRFLQ